MIAELQRGLDLAIAGETAAQRELVDALRSLVEKIEIKPRSQARGAQLT